MARWARKGWRKRPGEDEKVAEVRDKNRKLNGACGGWSKSVETLRKKCKELENERDQLKKQLEELSSKKD